MIRQNGIVQLITDGGSGSEASVQLQLRTRFPGLGGTVVTHQGVVAAVREEFYPEPYSGHKMFIRHLIIKKLDDYFYRKGIYVFSHIPRPLGSLGLDGSEKREAYIYEWAFGTENFQWFEIDPVCGTKEINLLDWIEFLNHFHHAGIDMGKDVVDPHHDNMAQNIIHQFPCIMPNGDFCSLWKRIDFGERSVPINFEKLEKYLDDNEDQIVNYIRAERFEMLKLSIEYLTRKTSLNQYKIGRLEELLGQYRRASLSHYAYGLGPTSTPVQTKNYTESIISSL